MPQSNSKTGVLIINLGTPESPAVKDVRRYLREFLMDRRVIDVPYLQRFLLVNFLIAPFRAPQSAKTYRTIWTEKGSPLKVYGLILAQKLQKELGDQYIVELTMRYQTPSIESKVEELCQKGVQNIIIIPLYPQYASSSTGSTVEEVMRVIKKREVVPTISFINQFFDDERFIDVVVKNGRRHMAKRSYDHFVFSYHGLPERQIRKSSFQNHCRINEQCCSSYHKNNQYCYRAQCFETTRLIAKKLGIKEKDYTVCFQSRLGRDPWIKPYTDEVIKQLAFQNVRSVLAFSPAFVADCLETTYEVGVEYKHIFLGLGGKDWDLVESLNDDPQWVDCLAHLVKESSRKKSDEISGEVIDCPTAF